MKIHPVGSSSSMWTDRLTYMMKLTVTCCNFVYELKNGQITLKKLLLGNFS